MSRIILVFVFRQVGFRFILYYYASCVLPLLHLIIE